MQKPKLGYLRLTQMAMEHLQELDGQNESKIECQHNITSDRSLSQIAANPGTCDFSCCDAMLPVVTQYWGSFLCLMESIGFICCDCTSFCYQVFVFWIFLSHQMIALRCNHSFLSVKHNFNQFHLFDVFLCGMIASC